MEETLKDNTEPIEDCIIALGSVLDKLFNQYPSMAKHCGFKEEREWRLIYNTAAQPVIYGDEAFVSPVELQLKLANPPRHVAVLNLENLSFENNSLNATGDIELINMITGILVGPSPNQQHTKKELKRLLEGTDLESVPITLSSIPYRPTK